MMVLRSKTRPWLHTSCWEEGGQCVRAVYARLPHLVMLLVVVCHYGIKAKDAALAPHTLCLLGRGREGSRGAI